MSEPGVDHLGSYLGIIAKLGFRFSLYNDPTHLVGQYFMKMTKRGYPVIHGRGDTPLKAVQVAVKDLKIVEKEYMEKKRKEKNEQQKANED